MGLMPGPTVIEDLDNDGDLDQLIFPASNYKYAFLENCGQNRFNKKEFTKRVGFKVHAATAKDLDQDGDLDIVTCGLNNGEPFNLIYENLGDLKFQEMAIIGANSNRDVYPQFFSTLGENSNLVSFDVNHDNWADIVIYGVRHRAENGNLVYDGFIEVHLNKNGSFNSNPDYSLKTPWAEALFIKDGWEENYRLMLVEQVHGKPSVAYCYSFNEDGKPIEDKVCFPNAYWHQKLIKLDFDGDGRDDLLGLGNKSSKFYKNTTDGFLVQETPSLPGQPGPTINLVQVFDFNGKGMGDYLIKHYDNMDGNACLSWLIHSDDGINLSKQGCNYVSDSYYNFYPFDFNQDGLLDFVTKLGGQTIYYLQNEDGDFDKVEN